MRTIYGARLSRSGSISTANFITAVPKVPTIPYR